MEAAISSGVCWDDLEGCPRLPEGLEHLTLPLLPLPETVGEEVNIMSGLTRLECESAEFWPSPELGGLKVGNVAPPMGLVVVVRGGGGSSGYTSPKATSSTLQTNLRVGEFVHRDTCSGYNNIMAWRDLIWRISKGCNILVAWQGSTIPHVYGFDKNE